MGRLVYLRAPRKLPSWHQLSGRLDHKQQDPHEWPEDNDGDPYGLHIASVIPTQGPVESDRDVPEVIGRSVSLGGRDHRSCALASGPGVSRREPLLRALAHPGRPAFTLFTPALRSDNARARLDSNPAGRPAAGALLLR